MLLVHQAGSVKVGEVVRYTVTYTPTNDRILPTPDHLHLKVKNTCAIPLRAAWIHGPYALHVAAYPSTFNPHHKVEHPESDGIPQYEAMLKAGGSWQAKLKVPDEIRQDGADMARRSSVSSTQKDGNTGGKVTWIVEVASQILFSTSASVDFEVLVGRDEKSLDLGFAAVAGHGHGGPGRLQDVNVKTVHSHKRTHSQKAGVYSKAVQLTVEDTEALWNKPELPKWGKEDENHGDKSNEGTSKTRVEHTEDTKHRDNKPRKQKKIHLVVATHGLHSNIGADMLFLKESIDATVKQAREESKKRRQSYKAEQDQDTEHQQDHNEASTAPLSGGQEDLDPDDDDEEQTIVRGFTGNAVKTENGIQYLGKRLAKYILRMTYPDQPFLPVKKSFARSFTDNFRSDAQKANRDGQPAHHHSSVHLHSSAEHSEERAYRFTSISFVGHSLGGLIQTYAIAYIYKHSPTFFEKIEPINFITMAAPMLGLSNENPMYVKFALDFGLVGRTGQDLGLTWRPPTLAKGGWNAMIAGFSSNAQKEAKPEDPTAKPLLRILPTGPAHHVLKMFRNRTLYSNVVNDGIVPLRTSCLLFLDWRGLGKVEKARRENGLIGTMAEWGWAEITGANSSTIAPNVISEQYSIKGDDDDDDEHVRKGEGDTVPQPAENETADDNKKVTNRLSVDDEQDWKNDSASSSPKESQDKGMLDTVIGFFRGPASPNTSTSGSRSPQQRTSKKQMKAIKRAQTIGFGEDEMPDDIEAGMEGTSQNPTIRPSAHSHHTGQIKQQRTHSRGDTSDGAQPELQPPPRTTIFESAGDILHPPLPSKQWITDPSTRSRTIFHDRVYHPDDIPPPPLKKQGTKLGSAFSMDKGEKPSEGQPGTGGMKIEEKIARAYHKDLSWRKVLVRLEPDAHNNMIVRRTFANAYGWPVIKHLCDTHFANTYSAQTRDDAEPARERAPPMDAPIPADGGEEVTGQTDKKTSRDEESRERQDKLTDLSFSSSNQNDSDRPWITRQESAVWDDSVLEGSDDDGSDVDERGFMQRLINPSSPRKASQHVQTHSSMHSNQIASVPKTPVDGHRGLGPNSLVSPSISLTPAKPASILTGGPESPLLANSIAKPEAAHTSSSVKASSREDQDQPSQE